MNKYFIFSLLCTFFATSLCQDESNSSSHVASIVSTKKTLRGRAHSKSTEHIGEKNGLVHVTGFQHGALPTQSIQAHFFEDEEPITFVKEKENKELDDYYWHGVDDNSNGNTLNLLVTEGGSNICGSANVWGKVYNIVTLPDYSIQVLQFDGSSLPQELEESQKVNTATRLLNQEKMMMSSEIRKVEEDHTTIDLLCLYTPQSVCLKALGTTTCNANDPSNAKIMENLCKLSVYETNIAFENSGVKSSINLVYSGLISPNYVEDEGEDMCLPLEKFKTSKEDPFAHARSLRDEFGADLVSLIVSGGAYCGCADEYYNGYSEQAFSVIHEKCAAGHFSFAHEIGHNLGCGHNRDETENKKLEGHAFGYQDPSNNFRTIMAYKCEQKKCHRIQHFSSSDPYISYDESPVGDRFHDNVKQINSVSAIVAAFRSPSSTTSIPIISPLPSKTPSPIPSPLPTPSPMQSPTKAPTTAPTATPTKSPLEKPAEIPSRDWTQFPTNMPSKGSTHLRCKTNDVIFSIEVESSDEENGFEWYLTNIRRNHISHHSADFEASSKFDMCVWSGNCYSFTIHNYGSANGHSVGYKIYADGAIIAQGTTSDDIAMSNISVDRKKKFNIGKSKKKGCFWLRKNNKQINYLCNKFVKLQAKCPHTCRTCIFNQEAQK